MTLTGHDKLAALWFATGVLCALGAATDFSTLENVGWALVAWFVLLLISAVLNAFAPWRQP